MHLSISFVAFALAVSASASPVELTKRAVSQDTFNTLVFYLQYASSAYDASCARPNGNTLIEEFSNAATDTQGFIARDDTRKEIVVALRGSTSEQDFITDAEVALTPFRAPGVTPPAGTEVHTGFLTAWDSVAFGVISVVSAQLAAHPGYSIVTSGHSLGAALSSLAAITLQENFKSTSVRMFTYGQPRTGNPMYASWIDSTFGSRAFRNTHTFDSVPTVIPQSFGYHHHGVEFWQNPDPASAFTVKQCSGDEDPTCSDSNPVTGVAGINSAHLTYLNIALSTPFCT